MMKPFFRFTIFNIVLLLSLGAKADFVAGPNYFTDTDTDIDWLFLSETAGMSYAEVLAETAIGGQFEGWIFASESLITDFLDNAGGSGDYIAPTSSTDPDGSIRQPDHGIMDDVYAVWGAVADADGQSGFWWGDSIPDANAAGGALVWGAIMQDDRVDDLGFAVIRKGFVNLEGSFLGGGPAPLSIETVVAQWGSALVRPAIIAPVPVPAAIYGFGIALAMIGRRVHRHARQDLHSA